MLGFFKSKDATSKDATIKAAETTSTEAEEEEARARAERWAEQARIEAAAVAERVAAREAAREAAEAEAAMQPEWKKRNAELPYVESYTDNPETIKHLKEEFESKVAEFNPKLANIDIANKLMSDAHDAHNGGKDIEAYDKMKSGADMRKAIAEFYEVTTDKKINDNELLQKRKEAWDRAASAYYWLKIYAKGPEIKSKIDKIRSNMIMWKARNTEETSDDYGFGYESQGSDGRSQGGKSRRKKSRKTKSRKRKAMKRRKSKRRKSIKKH